MLPTFSILCLFLGDIRILFYLVEENRVGDFSSGLSVVPDLMPKFML